MFTSLDHHAYALIGAREDVMPKLLKSLERAGVRVRGNPDVRTEHYELLGIDEAHFLKESAERTSVTGGKKIFIVSANRMSGEAQNSLLKLFEEPTPETHFFLLIPNAEALLPTLRSRLVILESDTGVSAEDRAEAKQFLSESVSERMKTVQTLLKALEGEKKDRDEDSTNPILARERIVAFLDALEYVLADDTKTHAGALSELLAIKQYGRDKAPSFKLLLEHLALVLPKI